MGKEITDLAQLEKLIVGETIPFYISNSDTPTGIRFNYSYGWKDQHKGKDIMVFVRGGDSTHLLAYITQRDWFELVDGFGLVMKPLELPHDRSFGYSYKPEDREFRLLYEVLCGKNPTDEEMELVRKGELYRLFFGEV